MILHINIDISQTFSPGLAVSVLAILALTNIRRAVGAGTAASPKSLLGAAPMHLPWGCTDALCWVHPAKSITLQPGSPHTRLCSLIPRNIFFTKLFWHVLLLKSSSVDRKNLYDYRDVGDTKILQRLHAFGTSALKASVDCVFLSDRCSLAAGEKSV